MKITVLSDNISVDSLQSEWGLSLYIEFNGKRILLDTGGSDIFLKNARKIGIDLSAVDYAVLSHAHYDHSLGMRAFFEANSKAPFYVSPNAAENCYAGWKFISRYIGMPKGVLSEYHDRIMRPSGVFRITDDVFVVPHSTAGLDAIGRKSHMYVKRGWRYFPDDYSHEQSLVLRRGDGLVVLNSCSHSGADAVIDEVCRAFPGENVKAYIGGLHLFRLNGKEISKIGERIEACGIKRLYTGHCTGARAFEILEKQLGKSGISVVQFHSGMEIGL